MSDPRLPGLVHITHAVRQRVGPDQLVGILTAFAPGAQFEIVPVMAEANFPFLLRAGRLAG